MDSTSPTCVICGAVGLRYTTDPRITACDEHANAHARDLPYAPAVRAAVAAERETCAKVAAEKYAGRDDVLELAGRAIAAEILSRGQVKP